MTRTVPPPHRQRAFTLLELMLAGTILALLAGVVVPSLRSYVQKGQRAKALADMRQMASVFNQYRIDTRVWPTVDDSTTIRTSKNDLVGYGCFYRATPAAAGGVWDGPYVAESVLHDGRPVLASWSDGEGRGFLDPWGRPYRVHLFADGYNDTQGAILLVCPGPDGRVQSGNDEIFQARPAGDDLVQLVTYTLR